MTDYPRLNLLGVHVLWSASQYHYVPECGLRAALMSLGLWERFEQMSRGWTRPLEGFFPDHVEDALEVIFHGK